LPYGIPYSPTSHRISLRNAVRDDSTLPEGTVNGSNAGMLVTIIDNLLVHLIRDYIKVVVHCKSSNLDKVFHCINRPDWIRGIIQDNAFCFAGYIFPDEITSDLVVVLFPCVNDDRLCSGKLHHGRIRNPVWRKDYYLISLLEKCLEKIVEAMLSSTRHNDLFPLECESIIILEFFDDCILQGLNTSNRCVFGETLVDRIYCCLLDVFWCIKIRFTCPEPCYV